MPTYFWFDDRARFLLAKKAREKLAARKQMKWDKIKADFARKRSKEHA